MCIVISGLLQVTVAGGDGSERIISELGRGETVGEMAILTGETRSADVCAVRESEVVELSGPAFERIARKYPQIRIIITRRTISRLRKTIEGPSEHHRCLSIALVPASPDVPLSDFTHRLARIMSVSHPVLRLNSGGVDSLMGISGISQKPLHDPYNLLFSTWLNEQENAYRYLLYETDSLMTPWTRRCLEHADQVFIVGWADHDPTPAGIEAEFLQKDSLFSKLQSTLVLLHPDDARSPSGTARWLADRRAVIHHHVCWNKPADMERLARFLSGAAVGLVLGDPGERFQSHVCKNNP